MKNRLLAALQNAALNYYHAAYYKTSTRDYYEGYAAALLNLALDCGYDTADIAEYQQMINDADHMR